MIQVYFWALEGFSGSFDELWRFWPFCGSFSGVVFGLILGFLSVFGRIFDYCLGFLRIIYKIVGYYVVI